MMIQSDFHMFQGVGIPPIIDKNVPWVPDFRTTDSDLSHADREMTIYRLEVIYHHLSPFAQFELYDSKENRSF